MISSYHAFLQMKTSKVSGLWSAWEQTLDDPNAASKSKCQKISLNIVPVGWHCLQS